MKARVLSETVFHDAGSSLMWGVEDVPPQDDEDRMSMKTKNKLRELLNSRNFSQQLFANEIGVTQTTISAYLRGDGVENMRVWIALRMAEVFGCTVEWLFDERQPMKSGEELEVERKIAEAVRLLGPNLAYQRLLKADPGEGKPAKNGGVKPDFGPPGISTGPAAPPARGPGRRDGGSRRSSG